MWPTIAILSLFGCIWCYAKLRGAESTLEYLEKERDVILKSLDDLGEENERLTAKLSNRSKQEIPR